MEPGPGPKLTDSAVTVGTFGLRARTTLGFAARFHQRVEKRCVVLQKAIELVNHDLVSTVEAGLVRVEALQKCREVLREGLDDGLLE